MHIILFIVDIICDLSFAPIDLFFIFGHNNYRFISFFLPNTIFLIYEFYVAWVCYSYTKIFLDGRDFLIKQENVLDNINKENKEKKDIKDNKDNKDNINQSIQLSEINTSSE